MSATVLAVCVVHADRYDSGRVGLTAIDKRPVDGPVRAAALGLDGDHVCNTVDHGGLDKAVYAYGDDEAARWADELGVPLHNGWFGENLRVAGLPVTDAVIGEIWRIGGAVLQVSGPRVPCGTFQRWSEQAHWVKRFTVRGDVGAYLRVLTEGSIAAGDTIDVVSIPDHGVTVRDLFRGTDRNRMRLLLSDEPSLCDYERARATKALDRVLR
ncbi:MOSC domain-containing protein [Antrihabitans cavernicola]|uniref:MOSC domain-containing protein n=1 Tax=Antrihabitans cavernicola TaxID=2495913 RepID=A0A5A7SBL6_9NOCA|nr:MOSC domain-containing protein [Spelaeibacter cavernicola]KAA0021865.1 MOSC domain-containing protein [Spelaeibacter cavernicola]